MAHIGRSWSWLGQGRAVWRTAYTGVEARAEAWGKQRRTEVWALLTRALGQEAHLSMSWLSFPISLHPGGAGRLHAAGRFEPRTNRQIREDWAHAGFILCGIRRSTVFSLSPGAPSLSHYLPAVCLWAGLLRISGCCSSPAVCWEGWQGETALLLHFQGVLSPCASQHTVRG